MAKHQDLPLNVIARSPFEIHYEGPALVLSATNRIGRFDILPGHADFFSVLNPGSIEIEKEDGELITFKAHNGIVAVRNNEVMLFVNM